ncbi:MAG TPA: M3 family oligoendopeptidase [Bacillales bacterium]|nr:M3 family oligoendopeptidase [Bacillales bacterium]
MELQGLNETWDLEGIFPGGSESEEFASYIHQLGTDIEKLQGEIAGFPVLTTVEQADRLKHLFVQIEDVQARLHEASAFISCLTAQDVNDKEAVRLRGRLRELGAAQATGLTKLDAKLVDIDDKVWEGLLKEEGLQPIAFPLNERRRRAADKMSPDQEALVNDLEVDGYDAWSGLYDLIVGKMKVDVEADGKTETLSVSQLSNRLSDPDRGVRKKMFGKYTKAWEDVADYSSEALNHISGFRLNVYKHRGWDSFLKEPLDINRMTRGTLDAMWQAIDARKADYVKYFDRKAELLGLDQLAWYDVNAPIGKSEEKVSYDEAAQFIVEHFRQFSPDMADFAKKALENRWIEAEDRAGKRPGGFCTSLPISGETRVFMTFSGTKENIATLAHELGHAYHQHVMRGVPYLAQRYAMNVAETASTFAEAIVSDASVKQAKSKEERLALMESKVQRSVTFFTNLRARFLFETRLYEERKNGLLSVERLNELMVEAQKEAFGGALSEYHPNFWESKLHFYITGTPFYNFPYTFGYLFSSGIYAKALEEGSSFADRYVALLRDTGRMKVEDLAAKHLDVDLTKPDFWENAVGLAVDGLHEFIRETK